MGDEKQAAVQDPLIGQVFGGKYSMRALIGRGGVGLVYRAENTQTHEDVVLKILSPDWLQKPEAVRRFERESERLGGVLHPNIVRLLDSGQDSGRAYLVMEYLDGELLSDFITARRRLDLQTFVPIAAQVLKGVGHAHSRGVMLRDIKPANIMLCERKGRANFVKILDFGLAKLTRNEQPVTEEHVLGTAGYLAPELIEGNDDPDLRVDVFSIGALFYFMLSGQLPFEGEETATVFYKTIHNDPVPLHDVLPIDHAVPEGLIKLVHQCLSKDPGARPDDANAIVEELIDVVPASLFRLPKIAGVPHPIAGEVPRAGYGNTGLFQLVGSQANSGRHHAVSAVSVDSGAIATDVADVDDTPSVEPVTLSHPSQDPQYTGPVPVAGHQNRSAILGLSAAVVLLAGGMVYFAIQGGRTPQDGRDAMQAREASIASAASADTRAPAPIDVASNLKDGTAATVKPDGLEADADQRSAQEKLEVLSAPGTKPEGVSVRVELGSRPAANLSIDGEPRGTTPFKGSLRVGTHTVRMTARGFAPWQGEFEVLKTGTEPLHVRLVGNRKNTGERGEPLDSSPSPDPVPKTTPTPSAEPATPKSKSVFLPTQDESRKDGGGVFLPTKD